MTAFSVQVQLSRLTRGGKKIAGAIPGPVKAASRHSIRFGGGGAAAFSQLSRFWPLQRFIYAF